MASLIPVISKRGVRSLNPAHYRPPWPLVKKNNTGWRKIGPMFYEKWKWPGQNREFGELHPSFQKLNPPQLHNYTRVQPTGYVDPSNGNFVTVPEMVPELVVPDLKGFELKPYVSYKTDVEIEKRISQFETKVKNMKNKKEAEKFTAEKWPPEKVTPKLLFDHFYASRIKKAVRDRSQDRINREIFEHEIKK
uniref:39S ribosomal protein L41, mitochondrial n=1 Tax=Acrobeloides nanus TaxID=290746 RepID=A0A914CUR8_9BILA